MSKDKEEKDETEIKECTAKEQQLLLWICGFECIGGAAKGLSLLGGDT